MPLKNPQVRLPHCATAHSHFHDAHLKFAQSVRQQIVQHAERQDGSAQVYHSDVGDQSGSKRTTWFGWMHGVETKLVQDVFAEQQRDDNFCWNT